MAFEVARQLSRKGTRVKGVILIDSPCPIDHTPLPEEIISGIAGLKDTELKSKNALNLRQQIQSRFKSHATMLSAYSPAPEKEVDFSCILLQCTETINTETLYGVSYPWLSDTKHREESSKLWEELIGTSIPVLDLACDHFQVFDKSQVSQSNGSRFNFAPKFDIELLTIV